MLCGDVLRDYPKQVVSSIEAENAPANMREFLTWTQKHCHIDAKTSVSQRKTDETSFVVACSSGRIRKSTSSEQSARFVASCENSVERRDWIEIHVPHAPRRRHTESIVEAILLVFLTKATSPIPRRQACRNKFCFRQMDTTKDQ